MNITGFKLLNILNALYHNDLAFPDLMMKLGNVGYVQNREEFIIKILNTIKICGIKITEIGGIFRLIEIPFGEKLSSSDCKLLFDLKIQFAKAPRQDLYSASEKLYEKIHLSVHRAKYFEKLNSDIILCNLEFAKKNNNKVCIKYKDKRSENGFVHEIYKTITTKKIVISNENGFKELYLEDIDTVFLINDDANANICVLFELYGRLAESYQLRENEQLIKYTNNGGVVILNELEDRRLLFQRLLRYDSFCKILAPRSFVEKFQAMLKRSLKNYGVDPNRCSKKAFREMLKNKK